MMGYNFGNSYSKEFDIKGIKETSEVFKQLAEEIGDRKATSKFLIPAMKQAMMPVLEAAKELVRKDTMQLHDSLWVTAKRPSNKDKRSKYVGNNDVAIAKVEVKPIKAKHKKEYKEATKSLATKNIRTDKKKFFEARGYFYDARAMANEFGTAKMGAKPFLRPALEGNAKTVLDILAILLDQKIRQYRSKTAK